MSKELVAKFETQLVEQETRWAPTLPPNIDKNRFKSSVMTAVMKNPALLQADRTSLMLACMQSASQGIMPDGREGAIVTFKDWKTKRQMAQWMPMTAGIVRRLRELGDLTSISAYCVYKGDTFEVELGDDPKIIHKVNPTGGRGADDIVAAYAIFKNGDEVVHRELMTLDEIEKTRGVSRAKDGDAWKKWFGEMARKTVIRRGSKSVPLSAAGAAIIETEDQWVDFSIKDEKPAMSNPLNDDDVDQTNVIDVEVSEVDAVTEALNDPQVVEDAAPEQVSEETGEIINDDDKAKIIIEMMEKMKTPERLEAFATKNKSKIDSLKAPAKGKVRSAYKSHLAKIREAA